MAEHFIYLDDFGGTGGSLVKMLCGLAITTDSSNGRKRRFLEMNDNQKLTIAPLMATDYALSKLRLEAEDINNLPNASNSPISVYDGTRVVGNIQNSDSSFSLRRTPRYISLTTSDKYERLVELTKETAFVSLDEGDGKPDEYYDFIEANRETRTSGEYILPDTKIYMYKIYKNGKLGYYASQIPPNVACNMVTGYNISSTGVSQVYMAPNNNIKLYNLMLQEVYGKWGSMVKYHNDKQYSCELYIKGIKE